VELVADLSELVQAMNREHFRRMHPEASEEELDGLLVEHILRSHDNEFATAQYRRVPGWPRRT
jgi:hypothetical protein